MVCNVYYLYGLNFVNAINEFLNIHANRNIDNITTDENEGSTG